MPEDGTEGMMFSTGMRLVKLLPRGGQGATGEEA
jgi:hypothetical protein